jgi:uncharacterized protein YxjI
MRFTIKQRIMAFGKQYKVFDESETQCYEISSMLLSPQRRKEVLDMGGAVIAWAEWPILTTRAELSAGGGSCALEIPLMSLKPVWSGDYAGLPLSIAGDLFRLSFTVAKEGEPVATIEKRVIAFSDTYEVDVNERMLPPEFVLLIVALIDHKYHSDKG